VRKKQSKIGQDGDGTFHCKPCGTAGFKSLPAARGHLSVCKGTQKTIEEFRNIASKYVDIDIADAGGGGASGGGAPHSLEVDENPSHESDRAEKIQFTELEKNNPILRYFRMKVDKLTKDNEELSRYRTNHFMHIEPKSNAFGDFKHGAHTFAPHPAMRHDPMTFGFSGMPEALGFNQRQWALIKLFGFALAGFLIWKLLRVDEPLARLVKKRLVRKI
jgi:hypothetical protein